MAPASLFYHEQASEAFMSRSDLASMHDPSGPARFARRRAAEDDDSVLEILPDNPIDVAEAERTFAELRRQLTWAS